MVWWRTMLILIALAGCNLIEKRNGDTMSLLHEGSAKVCTAGDVEDTLRHLIQPKAEDVIGDETVQDRRAAIEAINIRFDTTTLSSFDKQVSRATCNTNVIVTGADGKASSPFATDYVITPAARDETTFVISATTAAPREAISVLATAQLEAKREEREQSAQASEQEAKQRALLATVNRSWIVGRWIASNDPSSECQDDEGHFNQYAANGTYQEWEGAGRWSLAADQLTIVGENEGEHFHSVETITSASADTFSAVGSDGQNLNLRRCTRAEMKSQLKPDVSPDPGTGNQGY